MVPPMAVLVADIPVLQASYFMACRNFLKQKKISRYYVMYIYVLSSCQVVIGKIVLYILLVLIGWDK